MPNCLYCGKTFQRKHPSQKFCPKKGRRHLCKDRYHNQNRFRSGNITERRREYLGLEDSDERYTGVNPAEELYPFGIDDF